MNVRVQSLLGATLSALLLALPHLRREWLGVPESIAAVSYAWSVWLLARNHPLGWWVGLVGTAAYAWVFAQVPLYADLGLQGVYFATSLQAIWIWLRGGAGGTERKVTHLPRRFFVPVALGIGLGTLGLFELTTRLQGAVPFWDSFTTAVSLAAHLLLMGRFVESWYLWIAVDAIYVPLYFSRELRLTAILYAVFLVMAVQGLRTFKELARS